MAYWDARNQFLRTGVGVKETDYPLRLFQRPAKLPFASGSEKRGILVGL